MEYTFDELTVEVEEVEENPTGYTYYGLGIYSGDKGVTIQRGHIKTEYLEGAEGDPLEYFFKNLAQAHQARWDGEDPTEYLSNIKL